MYRHNRLTHWVGAERLDPLKGAIPYPAPRRTAFSPLLIDIDDEDRDEQKPKAQRTR